MGHVEKTSEVIKAYKLVTLRKDGSLGPLFISRRTRLPLGKWLDAEDHPTKGFAHRPGWHATSQPRAPHLSNKPRRDGTYGRVWVEVELTDYTPMTRPAKQGGLWFVAQRMRIVKLHRK